MNFKSPRFKSWQDFMSFFSSHISSSSSSKILFHQGSLISNSWSTWEPWIRVATYPRHCCRSLLCLLALERPPWYFYFSFKCLHPSPPLSSKLTWLLSILNLSAAFACRLYDDSGLCLCMMQFVSACSYQDNWFARWAPPPAHRPPMRAHAPYSMITCLAQFNLI